MFKNNTGKRLLGLVAALTVALAAMTAIVGASSATFKSYPAVGATSGDVFTYTIGDGNLTIGSEGDPADFKGIRIGEYVLSGNVYVVSGDVCNVSVSGNYLSAFDEGEYPVRIEFKDGATTATLKIVKAGAADDTKADETVSAASTPEPEKKPEKTPEPGMLEGGSETTPAPSAPAAQQNLINTGLDTIMVGFLALSGGSAALFGLGKRWLK